jgi:precorrin-2 C20-methyltransferase/precorrin-3B C17-methyltransferase
MSTDDVFFSAEELLSTDDVFFSAEESSSTGKLWGVGLGPGDPELVTVKAARLIGAADVIAFHSARHGRSIARSVAKPYLRDGQIEVAMVYPVTTETTDHPGGYEGAIADFYTRSAERLAEHLDAGRDVVVLCEGDPFFYGSYMYMHERLSDRYEAEAVPGVTSVSAASAVLGRPLVQRDEVLTILPGTLPAPELARRLADTESAAVIKLGRTFGPVRDALVEAGKLDDAWYVERATWADQQRIEQFGKVDPGTVPYFSLAVVPSPAYAARAAGLSVTAPEITENAEHTGEVVVVGLGPAGPQWLTPEAELELGQAEHLVGYGPYLARVPQRAGQKRHASGNRVEAERAVEALEMAATGARVAVVSSGDPGVFAMASAVLEQVENGPWSGVSVRIVPGVTAARRWDTTTACFRCPTGSSRGRSSSAGSTPRVRPIWCSRSTTRRRAREPRSSRWPRKCCCATVLPRPRSSSPVTSAVRRSPCGSRRSGCCMSPLWTCDAC